ncbi:MAG TPA: MDR family MFS transporter [bacterium]|nr:MDR family MFS transporter [bacterium]
MSATTAAAAVAPPIEHWSVIPFQAKALTLTGVLLGLFLAALDQTIVATALPAIIADLQGIDLLAWVSAGYLISSTTTVPIYGTLSDLFGRRSIVLFGMVVFLAGSALAGIAASMLQLIAFRVIQGIGAAALTSSAFAVVADLFAPAERPRYMGLFGAVFALSSVIGPYVGGLLTDTLSWRWVFYVNLPIGLVAIAFVLTKMPRLTSGRRAPIDWTGTLALIAAVVPLLLGLTLDKNRYPWTSPIVLGLFAVSALATVAFLWAEQRAVSPVIPLDMLTNRTFAVTSAASVLMGGALFGAVFFLSIFMVNVVGVSATAAGTALMPLTLGLVAGATLSSQIVQRLGRYRGIILLGAVVAICGFALLALMDETVTRAGVTWRVVVLGLGLGPTMPLLTLAVQNAVPFARVGAATAGRQFFMQIGGTIGIAVFGVILATTLTAHLRRELTPVLSTLPPAARQQVNLARLRSGFGPGSDTARAQAPPEVRQAVRRAFAVSVTRIYGLAGGLMVAAFLVLLALPQIPLRHRTLPEDPVLAPRD